MRPASSSTVTSPMGSRGGKASLLRRPTLATFCRKVSGLTGFGNTRAAPLATKALAASGFSKLPTTTKAKGSISGSSRSSSTASAELALSASTTTTSGAMDRAMSTACEGSSACSCSMAMPSSRAESPSPRDGAPTTNTHNGQA